MAALCDELAFWPTDDTSSQPDSEVINALRPGMATIPGAILLGSSSPYGRKGALSEAWRKHYGKDDDPILVWQAPTRTMNPTVLASIIAAETSAVTFLGTPAEGFKTRSFIYGQLAIGTVLARIIIAFTFIRPYYRYGVQSIYDFL